LSWLRGKSGKLLDWIQQILPETRIILILQPECMRLFNTRKMSRFFLLLLIGCFTLPSNGQGHLNIEDGLSQGMIFDLCQSTDGFLWIATKDGLNRYDGYNFKIYNHDPFDPFSIAENTILKLQEDSRGWLWLGTESKGIDIFDPSTERFYHFPLTITPRSQTTSFDFDIQDIANGKDGAMFVLHEGSGLVHFRIPENCSQILPSQANPQELLQSDVYPHTSFQHPSLGTATELIAVKPISAERVWVYTNVGVFLLNPMIGSVQNPTELVGESFPELWGNTSNRLLWFHKGEVREMYVRKEPGLDFMRAIPDEKDGFWVSIGHRLWHTKPEKEPDWTSPDFELDAQPSAVITDRIGNIWIGTVGYGIRRMNPREALFHAGAQGETIWGLWRDWNGRYFIKVVHNIFPYNPSLRTISKTPAFPQGPDRVLDLLITLDNEYWLLGREYEEILPAKLCHYLPDVEGIHCYDIPKSEFWIYLHSKLIQAKDGDIWITGIDCRLARFKPQTGQFTYYSYGHLFKEEYSQVRPYALAEDGNGNIWVGTQRGLIHGILTGDSLQTSLIQAKRDIRQNLNNDFVSCLLPDPEYPEDVLWIGTKGGGINRLHIPSGRIQHISKKDGLPDQVIYGIQPGDGAELWCSTNRGLVRLKLRHFSPAAECSIEQITNFTKVQGLQDNEFNTQAHYKAANGELLFGGINGLNRFFSSDIVPDTSSSRLFLVNLQVNYSPWEIAPGTPQSVTHLRRLRLRHDQNNLSFEFALLDFSDPTKNRYRYQLKGLDNDWVELGTHRFAHFTHLAPGSYLLEAQGSNGEGSWQAMTHPISIVIRPPWWLSEVALMMYAGCLIWLSWWLYNFQLRRLEIRQQLAFEHRETERIRALEAMKTTFFTNVTHEFRTPLTLVLEPARRILKKSKDPDILANARHIETNSYRLLSLVNQLLDLAKIESGSMRIELSRGNFQQTLQKVFETFRPMAEELGIAMKLQIDASIPEFEFDSERVSLILNNLLSNALKFTPRGGNVVVTIKKDEHQAQVLVQDSGIGIPPELLPLIFERFFQAASNAPSLSNSSGTGIGLTLSRELAELMGGTLSAQSEPQQGALFSFSLPLLQKELPRRNSVLSQESSNILSTTDDFNPSEHPNLDSAIVLLIEDSPDMREFIRFAIPAPWQVVEASDGEEGIQKARYIVPDLIISDLMMPKKDGYEVCATLKSDELTAHIPIILLTGKSAMESKLKGLRTGADDYLSKPFCTEELLTRMENLIESRKVLRARFSKAISPSDNEPDEHLAPPDRDFLNRLLEVVNEHLSDETLTVEELANKLFISRVQLHRKIKAIADKNTTEFVRDYRLERAMAMLRNREGLVYEIAYRVGFRSEKHFSRAFKEKFGISPSQVT
jgi:signal transduction histidine kinase/DNA-binding response OmpR family regulator/ligand-binding sensor domain-containing protein